MSFLLNEALNNNYITPNNLVPLQTISNYIMLILQSGVAYLIANFCEFFVLLDKSCWLNNLCKRHYINGSESKWMVHHNKKSYDEKNALYLNVNVFSTKVLRRGTIFTSPAGDRTAILRGQWTTEPREGPAACSAKGVPSFLSYFKTLSIGPAPGIEPATSRSAVKRSTDWANPSFDLTFLICLFCFYIRVQNKTCRHKGFLMITVQLLLQRRQITRIEKVNIHIQKEDERH